MAPKVSTKRKADDTGDDPEFKDAQTKQRKKSKGGNNAGYANMSEELAGKTTEEIFQLRLPSLEEDRTKRNTDSRERGEFEPAFGNCGVFFLKKDAKSLEQAIIAGYLNCPSTAAVYERLVDDPKALAILDGLHKEKSKPNPYGMILKADKNGNPKIPSFAKAQFFENLSGVFEERDVTSTEVPSDNDKYSPTSPMRLHLFYIRAAYRLIRAVPQCFPGPAVAAVSKKFIPGLGLEAEDLNRFIVAFINFYEGVALKSERKKSVGLVLPKLPIFCLPQEAHVNTARQVAQNRRAFESLHQREWDDANLLQQFHFSTEEEADEQPEALDGVGRHAISLPPDLPRLDEAGQIELLSHLASRVTYLHNDRDKGNKFFQPESQSSVRELCKEATEQDKAKEAKDSLTTAEKRSFKKQTFTQLQQQLNACSATPPSWENTTLILRVTVEELEDKLDELTQQNFRVWYRGLQLLPWQPQAAAYVVKMTNGPMKCVIICDDTGLGKTLSTLVAIVQRSLETQAKIEEYRAKYEELLIPHRSSQPSQRNDKEVIAATPGLEDKILDLGPKPRHKPVLIVVPLSALGAWRTEAAKRFSDAKEHRDITIRTFYGGEGNAASRNYQSVGTQASDLEKYCLGLDDEDEATSRTCILTTFGSYMRRCLDAKRRGYLRNGVLTQVQDVVPPMPAASSSDHDWQSGANQVQGLAQDEQTMHDTDELEMETKAEGGLDHIDESAAGVTDGAEIEWEDEAVDNVDEEDPEALQEVEFAALRIQDDLFSALVVDEAHRIKNPASLQTAACFKLRDCVFILCTASPFIYSVRDFHGLLRFPFKAARGRLPPSQVDRPNRKAFLQLADDFTTKYNRDVFQIPEEHLALYLSALDPDHFKQLIGSGRGAVDINVGHDIVPLPMMMTCLRRVMGDSLHVAGREVRLGAEIPRFEVTAVELRMGESEAFIYAATHQACLNDPRSREILTDPDEDDTSHRPSNVRRRRLQHAALNPALDQMFVRNVGTDAKGVQKLLKQGIDSFSVYHGWTKSDLHSPPMESRPTMAQYIAGGSVKLQALAAEILQVVLKEKRKMLIYADWPLNLWLIELFLSVCQIKFLSIRAGVSTSKRLQAESDYNDDPTLQVLVCSSRSAAESLNLQKGGWHIVVMDIIPMMTLVQIIGRGFRTGQTHPQSIKLFIADETYDQYLLHRYIAYYNVQVAATAKLEIPDEALTRVDRAVRLRYEKSSNTSQNYETYVHEALRKAYVGGLSRCVFGLRSNPTEEWADVRDVRRKNLHPEQRLFRLALGGDVANELLTQLRKSKETPQKEAKPRRLPNSSTVDPQPASTPTPPSDIGQTFNPTPFAAGTLARPINKTQYSESDHVRAMIDAAREMAKPLEFRMNSISPEACLRAAAEWVPYPSPYLIKALESFDSTDEPQPGTEDEQVIDEEEDEPMNDKEDEPMNEQEGDEVVKDQEEDEPVNDEALSEKQIIEEVELELELKSVNGREDESKPVANLEPQPGPQPAREVEHGRPMKATSSRNNQPNPKPVLTWGSQGQPSSTNPPDIGLPVRQPVSNESSVLPITQTATTSQATGLDRSNTNLEHEEPSLSADRDASRTQQTVTTSSAIENSQEKGTYDAYLELVANFRTTEMVKRFAKQEFDFYPEGRRNEVNQKTASYWMEQDARTGHQHRPDWATYEKEGKNAWSTIGNPNAARSE